MNQSFEGRRLETPEKGIELPNFNDVPAGTVFTIHSQQGEIFVLTAESDQQIYRYRVTLNGKDVTTPGSLALLQGGKNKEGQPTVGIWLLGGTRLSTGSIKSIETNFCEPSTPSKKKKTHLN